MEMEKRKGLEEAREMWDCGSPLYDSYELAALGHVLERHTMALALPYAPRSMRFVIRPPGGRDMGVAARQELGLFSKLVRALYKKRMDRDRNGDEKGKKMTSGIDRFCTIIGLRKHKENAGQ